MNTKNYGLVLSCTTDYIYQALVTLESAKDNACFQAYYLFVADGTATSMAEIISMLKPYSSWISILGPDDLLSFKEEYLSSFEYYNAFEVSNIAKYVSMYNIINSIENIDFFVYLDADVYVFSNFIAELPSLDQAAVLLSPHQIGTSDEVREHDHLLHGWVNTGFFIFNKKHKQTLKMLTWLIQRICCRGFLAPAYGMSGDQPWVSGLPVIFSECTQIHTDLGSNVAYWNLNERPIERKDGRYWVYDRKLQFFHFSGFDPAASTKLSKHDSRVLAAEDATLSICEAYAKRLIDKAALRRELSELETRRVKNLALPQRLMLACEAKDINLEAPTLKTGIFTKLGRRLDTVVSRVLSNQH